MAGKKRKFPNLKKHLTVRGGKAIVTDLSKRGETTVISPPKGKSFSRKAVAGHLKAGTGLDHMIKRLENAARIGKPPVSPHSENTGKGKRHRFRGGVEGSGPYRQLRGHSKRTG